MESRLKRRMPERKPVTEWKAGRGGEYRTGSRPQDEGEAEKENTVQDAGHMMEDRLRRRISYRKQATGWKAGRIPNRKQAAG